MFTLSSQLVSLSLATVALGATLSVQVGQNGLAFDPPSVKAAVGDIVAFTL